MEMIQRSKISKPRIKNHHSHHPRQKFKHRNHHIADFGHRNRQILPRSSFFKHGRYNVNRCLPNSHGDANHHQAGWFKRGSNHSNHFGFGKSGGSRHVIETNDDDKGSIEVKGCTADEQVVDGRGNDVNGHESDDNGKEDCGFEENEREDVMVGRFTREVYNAICLRLGDTLHIPEDTVKTLFNDMHLFPSDTQVTKMLQCARQYGRRNGANHNYLTFGEFCVFVREMQNHPSPKTHRKPVQTKVHTNKCPNNKCEVFLGGSCNPTTWRADTAIPELQKHGISFYNPQVSIWAPELLALEHDAKQSALVLLFVIDSQTRSTVGMLEVAYLVASGRCVIVVAQPYRLGQSIMGETISDREYYDLVEGQNSLLDLIKSKGVQIHASLSTALDCTADILRNVAINGTSPEDQIIYKLRRLREIYDSYNGQMRLFDVIDAYRRLTNRSLEISKLYNYLNLQNGNAATQGGNGATNSNLTFERFCAVMSELSTDGCGMCNIDVYTRPLYWSCALLKTRYIVRSMVIRPISTAIAWATQTFNRQNSTNNNRPNCAAVQSQPATSPSANQERVYDVYLGGSLSTGVKWREDVAVPLLKKHGMEYYNPAIRDQNGSTIENITLSHHKDAYDVTQWRTEIRRCKMALFVITNDTRSLTSMILAAHYIGSGKEVVLCLQQLNMDSCVVANETLTKNAIKDYNRARAYLRDLAERRQVPIFDSPKEAVECIVSKLAPSRTESDS